MTNPASPERVSHYIDYCKTACRLCAEGSVKTECQSRLDEPHFHMHMVHEDATGNRWVRCTAPTSLEWAEAQFERAERNWKAGAEAMRELLAETAELRKWSNWSEPLSVEIRALPIPEEPK